MQKRSSSTSSSSKTDNMSEQYRKIALKYRRHAAGDWIDEDSTEKELIRKALDIISIGDQPLISMQRDSLADIIIALGSQRDEMVRLLARINDAFSKKQKSIGGKDKQMRVREVTENLAGGTARKVHLAGQLAEKMGQMVDVNKRFIEEQHKEIKELNEELKGKEAGKIHEKLCLLNEQIQEMYSKIERTQQEIANLRSREPIRQDEILQVGESSNTILKEGEMNLAKAKELNKKLQERNMRVDSEIISKQMECLQLEEAAEENSYLDDTDIDNNNNNNSNKLRNISKDPKKQQYLGRLHNNNQQGKQQNNGLVQDLNKRLAEKASRKEVLEKQLSANEELTAVNIKRYEELLGYLESKGRQNDVLIEQFDKAMDNASQHLMRVSQLAAALDESAFKQTFPNQFKLLKQPITIVRQSPAVTSVGQSYWEVNRQQQLQQRNELVMEQGQIQDQRRQVNEGQKNKQNSNNGEGQQKEQEIFDGYESDDISQPKYSKNSSESDRINNQTGILTKKKQRNISEQQDTAAVQEGQIENQFSQIAKHNPSEVIKQQQELLQQLQLQLLEQTKQSELLQQQLQAQQEQQFYEQQGEVDERRDMESISGSEEGYLEEQRKNGRLKLPKIAHRQGQQQYYEQQQLRSQQVELPHKYRSPSVYEGNHPNKYIKNSGDSQQQSLSQSGRSQSVSQPSQLRHLRLSSLGSQQEVDSQSQEQDQMSNQTTQGQLSLDQHNGGEQQQQSSDQSSVSAFGEKVNQLVQNQKSSNIIESTKDNNNNNENNFTFAKNDPSNNTTQYMNTISSMKSDYLGKEEKERRQKDNYINGGEDDGDGQDNMGGSGQQSGNSSFQLEIRRNSSQKRMLRRKNHADAQGGDQVLSLIDASSNNREKDNQGVDINSNNMNNERFDRNINGQTTNREIVPIKTASLPAQNIVAENSNNHNQNKEYTQYGQPGTSSSFSSIVREATEKRQQSASNEPRRTRRRGLGEQDNEDEESKSIGNTIQSDGRRGDIIKESSLTKYMNRSLNEQALSYQPKGKNKSWRDLNQSYGVIRGVTPKNTNDRLNNTSVGQIKQAGVQLGQEQDESRSELNDSLIGRHHRQVSQDQRKVQGGDDNTQGKNKTNEKGRSSKVENRLNDSSFSGQSQKNHLDKQQMESSLTNFIKKPSSSAAGANDAQKKDLSSSSGLAETNNPKGSSSGTSNKPSKVTTSFSEQDQTQEGQHPPAREDDNPQLKQQKKGESQGTTKAADEDKEKDKILRELAEERSEKQKLKDMLQQQEIEKEMLLKKLQDQQKLGAQNSQQMQNHKDRRLSRGKVTWKDSEKGLNKPREFGDDPALRYICVQREEDEDTEQQQQGIDPLVQSQQAKHGKISSPKSSLKWRRAEQLQPLQQIQLVYPSQQQERQSYDGGQRGSSNGIKKQIQKQAQMQSQQQSVVVNEYVNFSDAKKELKIINSSVLDNSSGGSRSNSNTDKNGMQKSSLRNRIEKNQGNGYKQVD